MPKGDTKRNLEEKVSIVPRGEIKCIWMVAGVLSYKLCNRAFQCETCPLDRVLQSMDKLDSVEPQADASIGLVPAL